MEDPPDVETLITGLASGNESTRKFAVFKLQGLLNDPSFAEAFIEGGGLMPLKRACMDTTGNTQAYAFGSLDALLELDVAWSIVDRDIVHKAVELAVTHPLVNTVRNVLTLLVLVVSKPLEKSANEEASWVGLRAIKPVLEKNPNFIESLVQRLSASDHALCANALRLVNALMRDAILYSSEKEWSTFIKKLQDLGVIGSVGMLMRGEAAGDVETPLASAILNFQALTKVLLRRWKETPVSKDSTDHKRALKTLHLMSKPVPYTPQLTEGEDEMNGSKKHHPEKWRRLGFESESPALEFDETGSLGLMDFVDYARRNVDAYQKILMEQAVHPAEQRCPLAKASLSITLILYEHFEIEESTYLEDPAYTFEDAVDPATDVDKVYRPFLLQWGRLHTAAFNAFLRLWDIAGAELEDYLKIEELVRAIIERIVGHASRKTDIGTLEDEIRSVSLETVREWQMENYDVVYDHAWGTHMAQVREQLHHESLQFMKEQRIRCLLQGSWFPTAAGVAGRHGMWRYVRLSHNRRLLHYQNYAYRGDDEPTLDDLPQTIDLNTVTSVDSNVSASNTPVVNGTHNGSQPKIAGSATQESLTERTTSTRISIFGNSNDGGPHPAQDKAQEEVVLLEVYPQTAHHASEWLDGLLMLLNQQPITKDTTRAIDMMEDWGVRLRMLNLRWEDIDWDQTDYAVRGEEVPLKEVPSREYLEGEEYWYSMPES
ncbi:ELMO2 protein [Acrodontium crateriforme]|uniref:ELMO2 protein n=1 Tax=Acrodontium crateriforme TaxID=150365 RepID=A0AAQ3R4W6_9PEZI|nr:ELMO2 protein [Acrodontium crateriforme]